MKKLFIYLLDLLQPDTKEQWEKRERDKEIEWLRYEEDRKRDWLNNQKYK